jgi:hypothetical protein
LVDDAARGIESWDLGDMKFLDFLHLANHNAFPSSQGHGVRKEGAIE